MKISVGSKNPVKVDAVREFFADKYEQLEVSGVSVGSGVSDQPRTLDETVIGARNRAQAAFSEGLSVGIEAGLTAAPTNSGYFNICVGVIYNGRRFIYGASPGFEHTQTIIDLVEQGHEVTAAFKEAGITDDDTLGKKQGAIGLYTQGVVTRKDYTKMALQMAWIHERYLTASLAHSGDG